MSEDGARQNVGVHQEGRFLNFCRLCDSYIELDDFHTHVAGHGVDTT